MTVRFTVAVFSDGPLLSAEVVEHTFPGEAGTIALYVRTMALGAALDS